MYQMGDSCQDWLLFPVYKKNIFEEDFSNMKLSNEYKSLIYTNYKIILTATRKNSSISNKYKYPIWNNNYISFKHLLIFNNSSNENLYKKNIDEFLEKQLIIILDENMLYNWQSSAFVYHKTKFEKSQMFHISCQDLCQHSFSLSKFFCAWKFGQVPELFAV